MLLKNLESDFRIAKVQDKFVQLLKGPVSQDEALVATKDASHKPIKCPRPVQKKILKVWKQRAALSRQKPGEGNGTGQKCSNAEGASNIEARKRGKNK